MEDKIIVSSENFSVIAVGKPFVSREEGGHMIIRAKDDIYKYDSRLDFNDSEILEVGNLCKKICIAYKRAMKRQGIDIVRINYFEAGNWAFKPGEKNGAHYHEHIFGRVVDSIYQKFPEAPYLPDRSTGFYDNFVPLNDEDIKLIKEEFEKIGD